MAGFNIHSMIAAGARTNQTSASKPVPPDTDSVGFRIVCEKDGTSVNWLIEASLDDYTIPDANSYFFAVGYTVDSSQSGNIIFTPLAGPIVANTAQELFPAISPPRKYRKFRCVVSGIAGGLNYHVDMFTLDIE